MTEMSKDGLITMRIPKGVKLIQTPEPTPQGLITMRIPKGVKLILVTPFIEQG